jgi:hypothetical protein
MRKSIFSHHMEDEKEELRRKRNREYNRLYRERNREKVYQNNKAYREKHPELFRAYYHNNKERITTRRKEIVHCDCCNIDITLESMYRHKYSLGHLYLENEEAIIEEKSQKPNPAPILESISKEINEYG